MPDDAHEDLLEIAKRIAIEAGEAVLTVYDKGEFDAYQKEDDSPVTSADYLANDIITKQLSEATPDIPILSEENKHASLEERKDWPRYWLIDPIDGTQEFIARSGDFAVNIALIENNDYNPLAPAKAAFYSAILPGLGQVYNKKYWKIPIVYAGIGISIYFYVQNNIF